MGDEAKHDEFRTWQSAHVCPNCRYVIGLSELDLMAVTTGIVSCPICNWAGKIDIQVVDSDLDRP